MKELLGNANYGGWNIETEGVGSESIVYSFGIGEDISWDLAMIERFGCNIYAFDPTPRAIEFVQNQKLPPQFVFHSVGLAGFDGEATFYPPVKRHHVSHSIKMGRAFDATRAIKVPMQKLSTIMSNLGHDHIDILKMDIEGAEYGVLWSRGNIRPHQILVEFHHWFGGRFGWKRLLTQGLLWWRGYSLFNAGDIDYSYIKK